MSIETKFIPTASLHRAITCLESRAHMRLQIAKASESESEREISAEAASIDKAAAGDLRTLLDMANKQMRNHQP